MSEAFWHIQGARTAGFYIGKESMDAESETLWKKNLATFNGILHGRDSMNNEQTDNVSENSEDSIMHKACRAWLTWAKDNNITATNTQQETLDLMQEAFIDGYTNGFVKRFTEGA